MLSNLCQPGAFAIFLSSEFLIAKCSAEEQDPKLLKLFRYDIGFVGTLFQAMIELEWRSVAQLSGE